MRPMICAAIVLLLLVPPLAAPVLAQQGCPPTGQLPPGAMRVTIGHFNESADDLSEFCLYLVRHEIWSTFRSLGSAQDPAAPSRAEQALESGAIDVLWLTSYATGTILVTSRTAKLKVAAITDFAVLHVGSQTPATAMVTDAAFAPPEIAVRQGRSMFFADLLMAVTKRRPRCLEAAVGCAVYPGEGLRARLETFLAGRPGRAVVLASWAFPPKGPDLVVRYLHGAPAFHLVGIPAPTVLAMQPMQGMMAIVQIPKTSYGANQTADIPTGAVAQWLVSSTPPEVAGRVHQLITKINEGLLERELRLDVDRDLAIALGLVAALQAASGDRLTVHPDFARLLQGHGIRVPPKEEQPPPQRGKGG